jgi:N-acetylneuraminic acid mutarotase
VRRLLGEWRLVVVTLVPLFLILLAVKLGTGFGPDLPGPRIREELGIVAPFSLCQPSPDTIRRPSQPIAVGSPRWRRLGRIPRLSVDETRATAAGGIVYAGTGALPNKTGSFFKSLRSMASYDPGTGKVERLPGIPIPVDHTVLGTWHGDIYVFGGRSDDVSSDRAFRYSVRDRRWTELARMPGRRVAGAGATIGDHFYFVGGALANDVNVPDPFRTLLVYSFRDNRWRVATGMPTGRHHTAAAALDGELYVVGGRRGNNLALDAVERYDPSTDSWERLAPLPMGVGGLGLVAAGGRLLAISGGDDGARWVTPATWAYEPAANHWTRLGDLDVPRHGFGAAALDNSVYIFGGSPCPLTGRTAIGEVLTLNGR